MSLPFIDQVFEIGQHVVCVDLLEGPDSRDPDFRPVSIGAHYVVAYFRPAGCRLLSGRIVNAVNFTGWDPAHFHDWSFPAACFRRLDELRGIRQALESARRPSAAPVGHLAPRGQLRVPGR